MNQNWYHSEQRPLLSLLLAALYNIYNDRELNFQVNQQMKSYKITEKPMVM